MKTQTTNGRQRETLHSCILNPVKKIENSQNEPINRYVENIDSTKKKDDDNFSV